MNIVITLEVEEYLISMYSKSLFKGLRKNKLTTNLKKKFATKRLRP